MRPADLQEQPCRPQSSILQNEPKHNIPRPALAYLDTIFWMRCCCMPSPSFWKGRPLHRLPVGYQSPHEAYPSNSVRADVALALLGHPYASSGPPPSGASIGYSHHDSWALLILLIFCFRMQGGARCIFGAARRGAARSPCWRKPAEHALLCSTRERRERGHICGLLRRPPLGG